MHSKKLSIIIPLYNVAPYVARSAKSIATQAFDGLEVIVIDDGSTDNSLAICLKNLQNLNVTTIQQPNAGPSAARNRGIEAATGDYLLFLDSDDFLLPGALSNILTLLDKDQPDVLFGRYLRWNPSTGLIKSKPYHYTPPKNRRRRTEYILGQLPEPAWNAWRYIVRRTLILKHNLNFEEGRLCEDVKWTLTLLEKAGTLSFLQKPFYAYYHRRPNSIMNNRDMKRILDLNSIIAELLTHHRNHPNLCRILAQQSFLYMNEYCSFSKEHKTILYASYQTLLPLFNYSPSYMHHVAMYCSTPSLLQILSQLLNMTKRIKNLLKE